MNWLDRIIDRHFDVIVILLVALVMAAYIGVTWYAFHRGG